MTTLVQILIFLFFSLKIAALAGVMQNPTDKKAEQVSAKTGELPRPVQLPPATALPQPAKGDSDGTRTLIAALEERQKKLEKREAELKAEEQKLLALKKEILEKMDILKSEQVKLNAELDKVAAADTKRFKDLAKVFDSTPPAKAGAMLEVMDLKTAAGITMNMKKDKAGAIWGYLTPRKAVEITREITNAGKQIP